MPPKYLAVAVTTAPRQSSSASDSTPNTPNRVQRRAGRPARWRPPLAAGAQRPSRRRPRQMPSVGGPGRCDMLAYRSPPARAPAHGRDGVERHNRGRCGHARGQTSRGLPLSGHLPPKWPSGAATRRALGPPYLEFYCH
eukprot:scaffold2799_cov408-Prasinococcus_capsulatus_cf.AAC.13